MEENKIYKYDLNWCEGCAVQNQIYSCFDCGWKWDCKYYHEELEPNKYEIVLNSIHSHINYMERDIQERLEKITSSHMKEMRNMVERCLSKREHEKEKEEDSIDEDDVIMDMIFN